MHVIHFPFTYKTSRNVQIVIGYSRNDRPEPAKPKKTPIVIGYTRNNESISRARSISRPAAVVGSRFVIMC